MWSLGLQAPQKPNCREGETQLCNLQTFLWQLHQGKRVKCTPMPPPQGAVRLDSWPHPRVCFFWIAQSFFPFLGSTTIASCLPCPLLHPQVPPAGSRHLSCVCSESYLSAQQTNAARQPGRLTHFSSAGLDLCHINDYALRLWFQGHLPEEHLWLGRFFWQEWLPCSCATPVAVSVLLFAGHHKEPWQQMI